MSVIRKSSHFEGTRLAARPLERVENVREASKDFRRELLSQSKVTYYRSFELVRVPYPTKFGYLNAWKSFSPLLHLCNRLFVIQFNSPEGIKTMLASPSDWENARETPFFRQLADSAGPFASIGENLISKKTNTVLQCLAEIGLDPSQVDYLTYDHLHTQNVTRWLGANGQPAIFPNAKLLITREEWESTKSLIPWHNQWYCPGGIAGVDESKLIFIEDDIFLGEGVALVRTKGHTEGNHSIVASTDDGIFVTSENGVSLDAYAPKNSKVPGVADFARVTGAEVVLNGNTAEYAIDQYISMVQEKEIAGPSRRIEGYPNVAPSSESHGYWLFPRTSPTVLVGDLSYGTLYKAPIVSARRAA
ncbi:hypothetical protein [Stenotrophobium rhamnosiphilum]|uniref:Metallo-beta-lactamase domain-containing protein n=1 Tax=Stenotrophobium rhamnosiphilum TaxID=2029166 RepID=A0A2T5MIR8_9GAMM|nr:hypothetical protein [Stenotrophobium rhamnosiphilum]PTU32483.1 hypothetical protein CJD38_07525 [Stenotrophobium rhamnosiphilum]